MLIYYIYVINLNHKNEIKYIGLFKINHPMLSTWFPGSPNLTPCNYVFWGYVKDTVYIPLLSSTKEELKIAQSPVC